jgi:C2 domain
MTKEQIEAESGLESHSWVDSGTGRLGRLFLEVLGCDDLPNLDTGGFAGNKTDAFVSIVYEDTVVTTDIIDDCLSPRWMPWSKRAFIFHMFHASSQIYLGVFDYDVSFNPADDHDLVGRVTVDLSNLRKDTVYTLKYNIYTTSQMSARKRKGTITIRLRLDIDNERQLLLSSLEPPTPMYVNSKKRRDFRVVRYTCTGKYEMDKYNIQVINSYVKPNTNAVRFNCCPCGCWWS